MPDILSLQGLLPYCTFGVGRSSCSSQGSRVAHNGAGMPTAPPMTASVPMLAVCYNRQGRKANVGAGTATATEPTREHKQYATQGPTTYLCT